MMGATGEPSGYYPTDTNGLAVQNQPPMACVCYLASGLDVCAPLGYGGCEGDEVCFWWGCLYPTVPPWWIENCHSLCTPLKGMFFGGVLYYLCMLSCIGSWQPLPPPPPPPPGYPGFVPAPPHAPGCIGHLPGRQCVTDPDVCIKLASGAPHHNRNGACHACCDMIKWEPALPPWGSRCHRECDRVFPKY